MWTLNNVTDKFIAITIVPGTRHSPTKQDSNLLCYNNTLNLSSFVLFSMFLSTSVKFKPRQKKKSFIHLGNTEVTWWQPQPIGELQQEHAQGSGSPNLPGSVLWCRPCSAEEASHCRGGTPGTPSWGRVWRTRCWSTPCRRRSWWWCGRSCRTASSPRCTRHCPGDLWRSSPGHSVHQRWPAGGDATCTHMLL